MTTRPGLTSGEVEGLVERLVTAANRLGREEDEWGPTPHKEQIELGEARKALLTHFRFLATQLAGVVGLNDAENQRDEAAAMLRQIENPHLPSWSDEAKVDIIACEKKHGISVVSQEFYAAAFRKAAMALKELEAAEAQLAGVVEERDEAREACSRASTLAMKLANTKSVLTTDLRRSEAQVAALTEQVAKLEGLLKPLADAAYFSDGKLSDSDDPPSSDKHIVWAAEVPGDPFNHSGADYVGVEITVGDCRAARRATINPAPDGQGES